MRVTPSHVSLLTLSMFVPACGAVDPVDQTPASGSGEVTAHAAPLSNASCKTVSRRGGFESCLYGNSCAEGWKKAQFCPVMNNKSCSGSSAKLRLVSDEARSGRQAIRVEVSDGDHPVNTSGERSELAHMLDDKGRTVSESPASGTKYYAFSVKLDASWKSPKWGLIWQLHGGAGGSPPLSLQLGSAGYFIRTNGGKRAAGTSEQRPKNYRFSDGSLRQGRWTDFVVKIRWSVDDGAIQVWRRDDTSAWREALDVPRGARVLWQESGKPVHGHYWKIGLYRYNSSFTNLLWLDGFSRADSFGDAVAAAFGGCR